MALNPAAEANVIEKKLGARFFDEHLLRQQMKAYQLALTYGRGTETFRWSCQAAAPQQIPKNVQIVHDEYQVVARDRKLLLLCK